MKDYKTAQKGEANPHQQPGAVEMVSAYRPRNQFDGSEGSGGNPNQSPYVEKGSGPATKEKPNSTFTGGM